MKEDVRLPDKQTKFTLHELKELKKELLSKRLVVLRADKGGQIVILDQDDYYQKMNVHLQSEDIVEIKKDNQTIINRMQKLLKEGINENKLFFPSKWSTRIMAHSNPKLRQLYGLPKLHKVGNPTRPIVSGLNSPFHKLAGFLARLLSELFRDNPYHLVNGRQVISELSEREIELSQARMVSFDVTAFYPSIPLGEMDVILERLFLANGWSSDKGLQFLRLIHLVNANNYFEFNGKIYLQRDGLAMGSPLAPILANIYMENFEKEFLADQKEFCSGVGTLMIFLPLLMLQLLRLMTFYLN